MTPDTYSDGAMLAVLVVWLGLCVIVVVWQ